MALRARLHDDDDDDCSTQAPTAHAPTAVQKAASGQMVNIGAEVLAASMPSPGGIMTPKRDSEQLSLYSMGKEEAIANSPLEGAVAHQSSWSLSPSMAHVGPGLSSPETLRSSERKHAWLPKPRDPISGVFMCVCVCDVVVVLDACWCVRHT